MVSSTHEQNSICSPKKLNDIAHEQTIICRHLFAGHVVGSRPMKRKKHLHRMITSSNRYCSTLNNIACTTGSTQVAFGAAREARGTRGKGKGKQSP